MIPSEYGPALPWPGVLAALASYSSKGQLFTTLGHMAGVDDNWSARDVKRRARRILLGQLLPVIHRWPTSPSVWLDALPAQTFREKLTSPTPIGRINWPATRLHGWPPGQFVITHNSRQADEVLTTTLAWTLRRLLAVRRDATALLPGLDAPIQTQLAAAQKVLDTAPINTAKSVRPGRPELASVRSMGRPWVALARAAELLAVEDSSVDELARRLLLPDDDLRWRLFHLGCLGIILNALTGRGYSITSLRPIGIGTGPSYRVTDKNGIGWDLWFEAGGIWNYYKIPSPYVSATAGLPGAGQPLGADIALIRRGVQAIVVECKYSADPTYVGRDGYIQALTYLAEIRTGIAAHGSAIVIGPESVVRTASTADTCIGQVSITPPSGVSALLHL